MEILSSSQHTGIRAEARLLPVVALFVSVYSTLHVSHRLLGGGDKQQAVASVWSPLCVSASLDSLNPLSASTRVLYIVYLRCVCVRGGT